MTARRKAATADAPRVYSYVRFSTPEQAIGDSERRQLEAAKAFAARVGMPFDESLVMADRGISAYRGGNRDKGALGAFLRLVESGSVPVGSILVVEDVDRISRQEFLEAFDAIKALIGRGVNVFTTRDGQLYDRAAVNSPRMHVLLARMQLAHEESEKKSERLSAVWMQKKRNASENGHVLTTRVPAWLVVTDNGFEVVPGAAKTLRMIFDLRLKGIGKNQIASILNARAPWQPPHNPKRKSTGWRGSYVAKILRSRAVIGECQLHTGRGTTRRPDGEPIPNYFPRVIDPGTFAAVQKLLAANKGKGGETGKANNLFPHLGRCPYCGGSMVHVSKGKPPKGGSYLMCDHGRRGMGCYANAIRYDEAEQTILDNCKNLRPEQILPAPDQQAREAEALRDKLNGIDGQLADIEGRTASLMDQIERAPTATIRDRFTSRMVELDASKALLESERKTVAEDLARSEANGQSVAAWTAGLQELHKALRTGGVDVRLRARTHLRQLIDRVEVFARGFAKVHDPSKAGDENTDTEGLAEYIREVVAETDPAKLRTPDFRAFLQHVTARRMSKAGRFLRVHFKTGAVRDLVPPGSIADGRALEADADGVLGWRVVRPNLNELWREWQRHGQRAKV